MVNGLFSSTTIPVLEQVVAFTQARHGVLAGNVANLDTPGYRTRDLSPDLFEEKLREAVQARQESRSSYLTFRGNPSPYSSSQVHEESSLDEFRDVRESIKSILYHDKSDVAIEKQITEIAKNQAKHNLALSLMISQFNLLDTAISERV